MNPITTLGLTLFLMAVLIGGTFDQLHDIAVWVSVIGLLISLISAYFGMLLWMLRPIAALFGGDTDGRTR